MLPSKVLYLVNGEDDGNQLRNYGGDFRSKVLATRFQCQLLEGLECNQFFKSGRWVVSGHTALAGRATDKVTLVDRDVGRDDQPPLADFCTSSREHRGPF